MLAPSIQPQDSSESTKGDLAGLQDECETTQASLQVAETTEGEPKAGLFGGSTLYQKLGLKGGSKIRLGLFGGSPVVNGTGSLVYSNGGLENRDVKEQYNTETDDFATNGDSVTGDEDDYNEPDEYSNESTNDSSHYDDSVDDEDRHTPQFENTDSMHSDGALPVLPPPEVDVRHNLDADIIRQPAFEELDIKQELEESDKWYTVGFFQGNSARVQDYFLFTNDGADLTTNNIADYGHAPRIPLEPGAMYKFRVAAINSVGRSEWSPVMTRHSTVKFWTKLTFLSGIHFQNVHTWSARGAEWGENIEIAQWCSFVLETWRRGYL